MARHYTLQQLTDLIAEGMQKNLRRVTFNEAVPMLIRVDMLPPEAARWPNPFSE